MPTRLLVRYLIRRPNGGVARSEKRVTTVGDRVGLGRGSDNEVFLKDLRVNYYHATLTVTTDEIVLEAVGDSVLRVNDTPVGRVAVSALSRIEVGPYRVAIGPADPDSDLVLDVELVVPEAEGTVDRLLAPRDVRLSGAGLGRRPLAWIGFLLLLVVGLALPILAFRTQRPAPLEGTAGPLLATLDRIWISGPLSRAHAFLTDDCKACHQRPFGAIRVQACVGCHEDTNHHADRQRFPFAAVSGTDCTGCHADHVAPYGIVPTQQALCADCHRDLSRHLSGSKLIDVEAFDSELHPEFRVTLLDTGGGAPRSVALDATPAPRELSGIVFPHSIHLAKTCDRLAAVSTSQGKLGKPSPNAQRCKIIEDATKLLGKPALECADCHQPEPSGAAMRPIRADEHCGLCHLPELDDVGSGSDAAAVARRVPHGNLDELIAVVTDYELARSVRALAAAEGAASAIRRRTGSAGDDTQRAPVGGRAAERIRSIVEDQACAKCHGVTRPADPKSLDYRIQPVAIADVWMPKAHFSHAAHEAQPWRDGRSLQCTDCHKAETSGSSQEILMPRLEICLTCHGPEHTSAMVASTCVMCHVFHRNDCPPMRLQAEGAAACGTSHGPVVRQTDTAPAAAAD